MPDGASAIALLEQELRAGDLVLVKASQSIGLWEVADAVLAAPVAGSVTGEEAPQ